jgi:hypothetical protein
MTAEPTLRRYVLREDRPLEGWAFIVIGDDGFFAAVSDERCHRTILARDVLPKLGAVYVGELGPTDRAINLQPELFKP